MQTDALLLVPILAWLACGLAAIALTPKHGAAQALCASGVLMFGAWAAENAAMDAVAADEGSALLNAAADLLFFEKSAAIVAVLLLLPQGRLVHRWHQWLVWAMVATGLFATAARILGADSIDVGNDASLAADNAVAVAALAPLAEFAESVLLDGEPALFLVGIGVLIRRLVTEAEHRAEIRRVLLGIGALAALLVLVVLGQVTPLPILVPVPLFLLALAAFPVLLLVTLSAQARRTQRELAESRARLVTAEDAARRTLERDLHDGVQQQLVGILTLTELAARQAIREPALASQTLNEVRNEVELAIGGLRELVRGIRPPALTDGGVEVALADRFGRLPALVDFDPGSASGLRWPPEIESAAYFLACEAVTNAIKHAPGAGIRVRLHTVADRLSVEIADDGPGFGRRHPGTGLRGLRDRVESLGGQFIVDSSLTGTRILAEFPEAAE